MKKILFLTCEHAVNSIPSSYQALFKPHQALLDTHRGIDFGALEIALSMQEVFACDLVQATTSRLLIDCNRSLGPRCFSKISTPLSLPEKQKIIDQYYLPYRQKVLQCIEKYRAQGLQVMHCSVHSFTPILNNEIRTVDIGFLYDPKRSLEKKWAKVWKEELSKESKAYRIRMNSPYQGISDGLTTALRKKYLPEEYLGLELECNQALTRNSNSLAQLQKDLILSLSHFANIH